MEKQNKTKPQTLSSTVLKPENHFQNWNKYLRLLKQIKREKFESKLQN